MINKYKTTFINVKATARPLMYTKGRRSVIVDDINNNNPNLPITFSPFWAAQATKIVEVTHNA